MAILDLIQHPNEYPDEIVHRIPESGSGEFRLGSQLVVREAQQAVFVRDGKALDTFGPGRHTVSTNNIPLLTALIGLPFGGDSPFTAEVYFVAMREFLDLKWGTPQPLVYRDTDFGMIRLRAHGTYSIRVENPQLFVNQIVGTRGSYSVNDLDEYLRSIIINQFNDLLGETHKSILDIQGITLELASTAQNALSTSFGQLGLRLVAFQIGGIIPPDEVVKKIDERSGMAAVGDLGAYTQFQAAQAMRDAAQNEGAAGGAAGTGVGFGAGMAMGQMMGQAMNQASGGQEKQSSPGQNQASQGAPAAAGGSTESTGQSFCTQCGKPLPVGAKFCPNCGTAVESAQ
jgi:membrane protease subunit (stomatin/prohibitin family)